MTTGKEYYISDVVRIINISQVIAYLKNGAELYDLYTSVDRDDPNKNLLVFIFNRSETKELYDKWCKRELKQDYMD